MGLGKRAQKQQQQDAPLHDCGSRAAVARAATSLHQHRSAPWARLRLLARCFPNSAAPLPCGPALHPLRVQIMHYTTSVECRKVAVHCHAGLGRTGLAIACFLLASGQAASAPRAVEMVRAARPGSLQTQAQVVFVSIFEQYLQHLR